MRIWVFLSFLLLASIGVALFVGLTDETSGSVGSEIDLVHEEPTAPEVASTPLPDDVVARVPSVSVPSTDSAATEPVTRSPEFFNPLARIDTYFVGVVIDVATGAVVPGARVHCVLGQTEVASGVADEAGRYRTSGFQYRGGDYRLYAFGSDTIAGRPHFPTNVADGENRADLAIDRAGTIRVAVRDPETGNPVAGVRIISEQPFVYTIGETDSRGRLAIDGAARLGDRHLAFVARKPGHFGTRRYFECDQHVLGGRELEFLVGRECRIEVITRDADGKSIGGDLDLQFMNSVVIGMQALGRSLPFPLLDGLELDVRWHDELMIDSDGTRIFGELPPLPFSGVQLRAADRIRRFAPIEPFTACGQIRRVDMAIAIVRDPARLEGRVTMNGKPCRATLRWDSGNAFGQAESENDGSYAVGDIAPGVVSIEVAPFDSIETQTLSIGFKPGETQHQDFAFTNDPRVMSGYVRVDEEPVPGARVTLAPTRGSGIGAVILEATSDATGRFEFRNLDPDGEFWVQASATGLEPRGVQARSGSSKVVVVLER